VWVGALRRGQHLPGVSKSGQATERLCQGIVKRTRGVTRGGRTGGDSGAEKAVEERPREDSNLRHPTWVSDPGVVRDWGERGETPTDIDFQVPVVQRLDSSFLVVSRDRPAMESVSRQALATTFRVACDPVERGRGALLTEVSGRFRMVAGSAITHRK